MKTKLYMKMILVLGPAEKTSAAIAILKDLGIQQTNIISFEDVIPDRALTAVNKNSIGRVIIMGAPLGVSESCATKINKLGASKPPVYFVRESNDFSESKILRMVTCVREIFEKQKQVAV